MLHKAFRAESFHITRLDTAIDDRNEKPFFTIEQLRRKVEKREFVSRCNKRKLG